MFICPECGFHFGISGEPHCIKCNWRAEIVDGVPILVSDSDRNDPILKSYFKNYDQIADDDLSHGILEQAYVDHQVANMVRYTGNVRGSDVLDVGCGKGLLAKALVGGGARSVVAVDISIAYLRRISGSKGIWPMLSNAERLPFRAAFDVLTSTDVMEHVLNVGSFLISANLALRAGGKAVIRVPLAENLIAYAAQLGCKYRFVHLRTYNKELLGSALEGAGFRAESFYIDGFSIQTPQPFWMKGHLRPILYSMVSSWLLKHLHDSTVVTTWNSKFASLFMRPQEIVVVARKVAEVAVKSSSN